MQSTRVCLSIITHDHPVLVLTSRCSKNSLHESGREAKARLLSGEDPVPELSELVSTGINPMCRGLASLDGSPSLLG